MNDRVHVAMVVLVGLAFLGLTVVRADEQSVAPAPLDEVEILEVGPSLGSSPGSTADRSVRIEASLRDGRLEIEAEIDGKPVEVASLDELERLLAESGLDGFTFDTLDPDAMLRDVLPPGFGFLRGKDFPFAALRPEPGPGLERGMLEGLGRPEGDFETEWRVFDEPSGELLERMERLAEEARRAAERIRPDLDPSDESDVPEMRLIPHEDDETRRDGDAVPAVRPRAMLGIRLDAVPPALSAYLRLDPGIGVLVTDVLADTPAAAAGLEPYDVIVAVEHGDERHEGLGPAAFRRLVARLDPDAAITLHLVRTGRETAIDVVLDAWSPQRLGLTELVPPMPPRADEESDDPRILEWGRPGVRRPRLPDADSFRIGGLDRLEGLLEDEAAPDDLGIVIERFGDPLSRRAVERLERELAETQRLLERLERRSEAMRLRLEERLRDEATGSRDETETETETETEDDGDGDGDGAAPPSAG